MSVISQIRFIICALCCAATSFAETPVPTPTSAPTQTPTPPNIILITLDTTRADRMGFLGSKLGLTPNLDALATGSAIFTRAYSQVPLTAPSHATILTGTYPQFHHVNDFQVPLASDLPYAPAILRDHGYHTAAFVGSMILDPSAGFARGFVAVSTSTTPDFTSLVPEKTATVQPSAAAQKWSRTLWPG